MVKCYRYLYRAHFPDHLLYFQIAVRVNGTLVHTIVKPEGTNFIGLDNSESKNFCKDRKLTKPLYIEFSKNLGSQF